MNLSFEGKKIRSVIRAMMKKNGYKYVDLAKALRVSEPTVKRIMTRDDFSLERLILISEWLGLSVTKLMELASADTSSRTEFTPAQEEFLARSPRVLVLFYLLATGWQPEQIEGRYGFRQKEIRKALSDLERIGLLEVWPGKRVRVKIRGYFRMSLDGPMKRAFSAKAADLIWSGIRRKTDDSGRSRAHPALLFAPFELTLKDESYRELLQELSALLEKYRAVSATQISLEKRERLKTYSGILMSDEYFVWPDIAAQKSAAL